MFNSLNDMYTDDESREAMASGGHIPTVEKVEEESVFTKLEKTRTMLETTLGLASLLEAYQLIQVSWLYVTVSHVD